MLIVHLKRFQAVDLDYRTPRNSSRSRATSKRSGGTSVERSAKYYQFVKNEVELKYGSVMDLAPFLHEEAPVSREEARYQLYAVVAHSGSLTSGHYTSVVKQPCSTQWLCFNDQYCTEVDAKQAQVSRVGVRWRAYRVSYVSVLSILDSQCLSAVLLSCNTQ